MRFFILITCLLTALPAVADSPSRPFPHGQEDKAPVDEESPKGPAADEEMPCTLDFETWVRRQEAPTKHPERAKDYLFEAEIMQRMGALAQEWPGLFPSLINNIIVPRDGLASSGWISMAYTVRGRGREAGR